MLLNDFVDNEFFFLKIKIREVKEGLIHADKLLKRVNDIGFWNHVRYSLDFLNLIVVEGLSKVCIHDRYY